MSAPLTKQQLADYRDNGFAVVPDVITSGERTLLTVEYPTLITAEQIFVGPASERVLPESLLTRCRAFAAACLDEDVELAFAQWYAKPPSEPGGAVPWHQDRRFWPASRPETVTTWLAIDRADEANGCLEFAPGSHREGGLLPHRMRGGDLPTCCDAITGATVTTPISAGAAVIYNELVAHRTGPNQTEDWRRALILAWNTTGA